MMSNPQPELCWKTPSCNNGSCIAVAMLPDGRIAVRDTKHRDGPVLNFSAEAWEDFIEKLKKSGPSTPGVTSA
ncbi:MULTISPECIES: DUF397 domain-containing protein [Nonomuraea]|uniref:DUF397 domain-containing protein n=1 Tax=Nonomuraea ferruginea TaxID=46174 RepID=A0ABT4SSW9_9ACTN|nr:DUF397 domain-containing protein [Nonomuraea ferruginea]MDA0640144.1 DUF397 domain-containing protein [Nonomuraea ferruginea]